MGSKSFVRTRKPDAILKQSCCCCCFFFFFVGIGQINEKRGIKKCERWGGGEGEGEGGNVLLVSCDKWKSGETNLYH